MFLVLTIVFFLMSLPAPEASRVLLRSLQMQLASQVHIPPTISRKAFTSDHFNDVNSSTLLRRQLYTPSGPNPGPPHFPDSVGLAPRNGHTSPHFPNSMGPLPRNGHTSPMQAASQVYIPPTISQKAYMSDHFNDVVSTTLLGRQLYTPSGPNPGPPHFPDSVGPLPRNRKTSIP